MAWKDNHRDIKLARQVAAVKGAGPTEDNEREVAWVESAANRNQLGGIRHVRICHTYNRVRSLSLLQAQRSTNCASDSLGCALAIEL